MEYLIFALVTIVIWAFTIVNMFKYSIISTSDIVFISKRNKPSKRNIIITLTILICCTLTYVLQMYIYKSAGIFAFVKLCALYSVVLPAAIIDFKLKIIPNYLICIGLLERALIYVAEIFLDPDIKAIFINDLIGFALGFGILFLVAVISKQALGFGDVKLFAVIGLTLGAFGTYSLLFASVMISAIASIFLLIFKKKGKKDSIPFGPCILVGYIIVILLGSY